MANETLKLEFLTVDVFTTTRFAGNPLAIVRVPQNLNLSQDRKQSIAREFNLSETVFLHEPEPENEGVAVIDIFTTSEELPFAGHPTVGTGWYLLSGKPTPIKVLRTKAGDIPISLQSSGKVRVQVPFDFKVHTAYAHPTVKSQQLRLNSADFVNGAEPVVSIVKGMTFILLQLASEAALAKLQPYSERTALPEGYLGEWKGLVAVYAFFEREDGVVRTRMMDGFMEDPATGSAASTLACWLATRKGPGETNINILQGVEMGRRSEISVTVQVGEDGQVQRVQLEGAAVSVMEGQVQC